jgi:dienelactone hydrolase/lysophospholipase L1-like esterase
MTENDRDKPQVRDPRSAPWRRWLAWTVLWVAGLGVLTEAYARVALLYWGDPRYVLTPLSRRVFTPDADCVPGVGPTARNLMDQNGLRSAGDAERQPPNVLVVGGSTVECLYLDQEATFGAEIGKALQRASGRRIVVTSAAKSGLLAWHSARYVDDMLPKLPGVRCVVAMLGINDANQWLRGNSPAVTQEMVNALYVWPRGNWRDRSASPAVGRLKALARSQGAALLRALHLVSPSASDLDATGRFSKRLREHRQAAVKVDLPADRRKTLPAALAAYRQHLTEIIEASLSRDVEPILATQPMLYADNLTPGARSLWWSGALGIAGTDGVQYLSEEAYHWSLEQFNNVTRSTAAEYNLTCVDLAKAITDAAGEFFFDTLHFNDAGARKAGEIVARAVEERVRFAAGTGDLQTARITYASSVSPEIRRLGASVFYRESWKGTPHPILVLMHGFMGDSRDVERVARYARSEGFFAIAPDMRGRNGSDGQPDIGGVEIQDIVDAVECVKKHWSDYVDPTTVAIEGFSGGGGNVLSAVTKFPQYWSAGLSWFGISDYGYSPKDGWYHTAGSERSRALLERLVGDPATDQGKDAYASRASILGAGNAKETILHLFVEADDTICPPEQSARFVEQARAAGLANVSLHLGREGRWKHGYPSWESLRQTHRMVWPEGAFRQPSVKPPDRTTQEWTVLGYILTRDFNCWLGNGGDAVATVEYAAEPPIRRLRVRFRTRPTDFRIEVAQQPDEGTQEILVGDQVIAVAHPEQQVVKLPQLHGDQDVIVRPAQSPG